MGTNLSKFIVLVLVASAILALAGCEAFDSVAPKTQQETVPERAFDLNISVTMLAISTMGHFLNRTHWHDQAALTSSLRPWL